MQMALSNVITLFYIYTEFVYHILKPNVQLFQIQVLHVNNNITNEQLAIIFFIKTKSKLFYITEYPFIANEELHLSTNQV